MRPGSKQDPLGPKQAFDDRQEQISKEHKSEEILERLPSGACAVRVKRVAELLDCSKSLVYGLIKSGDLKAIHLTHTERPTVRVLVSSIEELLGHAIEESSTPQGPLDRPPTSASWANRTSVRR